MTRPDQQHPRSPEMDRLAAEHALRLLEGEELVTARGLMASDTGFAAAVADWENKLAPLHDITQSADPSPQVWARIAAELYRQAPSAEVVTLKQRVRRWQLAASAAAAVAVCAFAFSVVNPDSAGLPPNTAGQDINQPPLMANIPIVGTPLRLAITYLPGRSEMLVSASGLTADGVHDHELWLVTPDDGARSLGVVVPGAERRVTIDPALAAKIVPGAQIALSREALGGAADANTPGPVVASGAFSET
ncbi:anti-sigma factor [Pontixanthobacter sp.]|uniref:anti-sigma factor n=1 Tax=Pontixanthobacter sp. TaxID=2792078 RepID=UPI003C7B0368